ncbi:restriction endonuclease subunit S [Clostridium guangxiense]|uniref:restriction endonuclease subunit S n=1 Tax=Clostridium guangxiense TaxID=1662055 RepID=UPI001E48584A|nr:restriction endonuclease subunit S [Clostridium guangxiense]MCD2347220.1 restriction endonuclease subunit S [Clostridium guangxiense]
MRKYWIEAKLEDMLEYIQPSNYIVDSVKYSDNYKIPVLTAGKTFILGYTNEKHNIFSEVPVIIFDDFTTATKFVNFRFKVKSSAMKILIPTSNLVNLKYVFYYMQTIRHNTDTHKRYWISIFSKLGIKIAPLPEQRAIVTKIEELFSKLDNGIDNLKKAKEKLQIYRQAVLKKAFEGDLTKEWRDQQADLPSAEELLEKIKKERENYYEEQLKDWKKAVSEWEANGKVGKRPSKPKMREFKSILDSKEVLELSDLPKNWFYNFLAYSGELGRGKSKHRPRNDSILFGGKYPFIQTAEVKAQDVIMEYSQTYSDFGLAQSKLWPKGTLCITIAANIAETGFLGIDACFPDSVVGFTPFESIIDKRYIDYFFKFAKMKISSWAPATAQKNINLNILENIIIPYCCLKEQIQVVSEIETRLSVCDNVITNIDEGLEKAEALRQSILKKAFEGRLLSKEELEVCRRECDWETAEKLLDRIKNEKKEGTKYEQ